MYRSIKANLTGVAPLIINNGHLANPMNPFAQAMKRITDKRRSMTEADLEEKAKIQWYGSLYLDDQNRICIPDYMIEATLINAAKKTRQGQQAKAGLIVSGMFLLQHDGPENIDELWESGEATFTTMTRPNTGRVLCTRPRFNTWSTSVEIEFDDEQLNASDVERFLVTAGRVIGLGNWRPRYGRFDVQIIS